MTESQQKYTFVDLFAGAGGFGLGFQMSGFYRLLCSIEKDLWAVETLCANNPHHNPQASPPAVIPKGNKRILLSQKGNKKG